MGASASLFTPEVALQLSESSLQAFYRYQEESEERGYSEEELYYMCEKKFYELLEHDKAVAANKKKTPAHTRNNNLTEDFTPDQAHLAMMQHNRSEEESLSAELQAILTDASDVDLSDFDQTYTQVLVNKVFDLDKFDRLHKKGLKGHFGGNTNGRTTPEDESHEAFMCRLCHICFESKTVLESHLEYSELHRKNIAERERRVEEAHNEALRLTALAKNVAKALYMGLPITKDAPKMNPDQASAGANGAEAKKTTLPPGTTTTTTAALAPESYEAIVQALEEKEKHHKEVRGLWKHAVDKILHRRMCEKYTHHLMTRINVPRGVELLYEGCKYFHRTKTTYDLRYLYHAAHDVIEIIPHFVPFNHETSTLEETEEITFLAAKRIYLRYSQVVKAFFGYNITHTELTDDLHVGDAPLIHKAKSGIHDAEVQAMDIFITNRLKIHKSHGPEDALFFDLHGIAHETLLKELPRRFAPAEVEVEVIANIWRLYAAPTAATSTVLSREGTIKIT